MIISRTPVRVSFCGGGTDVDEFAFVEPSGGRVTSVALNRHVYVTLNPRFDDSIRVSGWPHFAGAAEMVGGFPLSCNKVQYFFIRLHILARRYFPAHKFRHGTGLNNFTCTTDSFTPFFPVLFSRKVVEFEAGVFFRMG